MLPLKGKHVLITQNALHKIAGSEVNTLEIAKFFSSQGARVTIYTLFESAPMNTYFKDLENIRVISKIDDHPPLSIQQFDLIWVHQQILPPTFADEIDKLDTLPIIIFFYMSSSVSIELPYTAQLEEKFASKILYVSQEAADDHARYRPATNTVPVGIFPNPAPVDFTSYKNELTDKIQKILIVSNHPPAELIEATEILRERGITVVFRGETSKGTPTLVTPEELLSYDTIVSIGKTVQYCLCLGVPVYVYDHFGGPGYLNSDNILTASNRNFSGRGFRKLSADHIATDIIGGFPAAQQYQSDQRDTFTNTYSIATVFDAVTKGLLVRSDKPTLTEAYRLYMKLIHSLVSESVINQNKAMIEIAIKNTEYGVHRQQIEELNQHLETQMEINENRSREIAQMKALMQNKGVKLAIRLKKIFK